MGRIITGFLSLMEVGWHGLVISVANGRSKSACSGFAREGAKARSLFGFATDLTDGADFHRFFMVG
jgi:hypothetical protein